MQKDSRVRVITALATLYLAWSSTYLAIRFALEGFPPFFIAGFRNVLIGAGIYIYLRAKGAAGPSRAEWGGSATAGAFLLLGGTAGVVYAEQWVGSAVSALVLATTPLLTVLFAGIWRQWPERREWIGLMLGLAGIALLNLDGDLRAHPLGAALLVLAALSWSFGSVLSLRLPMPSGMMASATQMFSGGLLVMLVGTISGERLPAHPSLRSLGALIYLAIFGSLLGYTAYTYLLKNVRPALATSYAYVNPVLAMLLGVWLGGEHMTTIGLLAMAIILAGVVLVIIGQRQVKP
ncbi:MAG TPA: drug/metabolite exporter YedA [Nitrospirota bacterium]|nr:drug/metabolite exporter YedA [Nitrospirota bacterium]